MEGTLKLKKSVFVNGVEITEIPYDFDSMTAKDKRDAGRMAKMDGVGAGVAELDSDYHFYLFAKAVEKANKDITLPDLMRISAKDSMKGSELARDFFFSDSEELTESPMVTYENTSL